MGANHSDILFCITVFWLAFWLARGVVNSMKLSSCAHIKNDLLTQRGTVWSAFRLMTNINIKTKLTR